MLGCLCTLARLRGRGADRSNLIGSAVMFDKLTQSGDGHSGGCPLKVLVFTSVRR